MTNYECILVRKFSNFLASVSVVVHGVKKVDLGDDKIFEDEGYERLHKQALKKAFLRILYEGSR